MRCAEEQPPHVKAHYPATLVAQLGSTVRIACPVYGHPRPLVSWTKDSASVHLGWQRYHTHRSGTWLYIADVQATDAGRYTCEATNGFGTTTVTINLYVVRKSSFTYVVKFARRHTDARQKHHLMPPPIRGGDIIISDYGEQKIIQVNQP